MTVVSQTFALKFYPENWSFAEKFQTFMGPPFVANKELGKGTATITSHIHRHRHLSDLANRVLGTLQEDQRELDETGMTHGMRFQEFALLVESLYCELYSCLDGLRRSIFGVYGRVRGVQNGSTEKLFRLAHERRYGPEFPEFLRLKLDESWISWFSGLRDIRTEVTHGEVGSCSLDREKGTVTYFQHGLRHGGRTLMIEDVVSRLNSLRGHVIQLIDEIFSYWYHQLELHESTVVCGIWKGRMYQRLVAPEPELTFASGRCESVNWFRTDPENACPLRGTCGAYARREQQVHELAYKKWLERGSPLWSADQDWSPAEEELTRDYLGKYGIA